MALGRCWVTAMSMIAMECGVHGDQGPDPIPLRFSGPNAVEAYTVQGEAGTFEEYLPCPTNFNVGGDGQFFFLSSGKAVASCDGIPENTQAMGVAGYFAESVSGDTWMSSTQSPFGLNGPLGNNSNWPLFARCDWLAGVHATGSFEAPGIKCKSSKAFSSSKTADSYHCVMYFSVNMFQGEGAQRGAACLGRAVGNGYKDEADWVADDKPVYCSNLQMDDTGMPTATQLYSASGGAGEWASETTQALGIDPDVFEGFDGNLYLVWGSDMPGGAQVALLDGDGFISSQTTGKNTVSGPNGDAVSYKMVAHMYLAEGEDERTGEAPAVLPHECDGTQYYFLFWTWNRCCNGLASTYETVMGRSTDPFGPYLDKDGNDMAQLDAATNNPGGSYFLQSAKAVSETKAAIGSRYIGPGHVAFFEYTEDAEKVLVATFHFYDGLRAGEAHMGARRVRFDDSCWPYVENTTWGASEYFGKQYWDEGWGVTGDSSRPVAGQTLVLIFYMVSHLLAKLL